MTTQATEAQLEKLGFVPSIYTAQEERESGHKHVGPPDDWEFHFDYLDGDGVYAHALKAIDAIEF